MRPMEVIDAFERDCAAAGLKPVDVLRAAGLHRSTWFRWKRKAAPGEQAVSPNLRSLEAAKRKLAELAQAA